MPAFGEGLFGAGAFGEGAGLSTTIVSVTADVPNHRMAIAVSTGLTATHFILTRYFGTVNETVRGDAADDATHFAASGATRTLYDTESPRGTAVSYLVQAVTAIGTVESSTWSASVNFDVANPDCDWWAHPVSVPRLKVEFEPIDQPGDVTAAPRGVFDPIGRSDSIVTFGKRRLPSGSLVAMARTPAEANALDESVGTDEVLILRAPAGSGWGNDDRRYIAVMDIPRRRLAPTPTSPSALEFPWLEVVAPSMPILSFGATWQDVVDGYATWTALLAAHASWDSVVGWVP